MPSITVDFSDLENVTADVIVAPGGGLEIVGTGVKIEDGLTIPAGGTAGQVLTKVSGTDFEVEWDDPSGGVESVGSNTEESLVWVSNGDDNGVFHRIGTNFGAQAWSNPHTAGRIVVSGSSDGSGVGSEPIANIVDRSGSDVFTDNIPNSFFVFDLGFGRALELTDWTYQSRDTQATQSTPVAMDLEGSNDNLNWTPIDSQTGISITSMAEWLHFSVAPTIGFRYFRLKQTAANFTGTHFFTIGEFEIYGDLTYGPSYFDGSLAAFETPTLIKPLSDDASTPVDAVTPAGYIKFNEGGADAWIPYYR